MTLHISTGDAVVGFGAVYLYWRRCGTVDGRIEYGAVDLYLERNGRVCRI